MKTAIELIADERREQIEKHGWNRYHDASHTSGELAKIAAILAVLHTDANVDGPDFWASGENPWGLEEKLRGDEIHCLKVADALIAADIDRKLRLQKQKEEA